MTLAQPLAARPRVAVLGTRGYPSFYGGFETLLRHLVPHLADNGWSVDVYGRDSGASQRCTQLDHNVRSIVTRGVERRTASTLSYGLTSTLHATREKPDVALIMNVANGFWLPALRARSIPTVVNVDGMEWERAKWGRMAKRVFRAGAWMTGKVADHIVCDSSEIARRWRDEFSREGVFIPYGGSEPAEVRSSPGLTPHTYALFVARFVPENSVLEFVEAAEQISRTHEVVIVGSSGYGGPIEDLVRTRSSHNPHIHWKGHIADDVELFSLWANAGAYFHGHSVGGTNPALVQAMACGAPTVARDTVYNREVLDDAAVFTAAEPGAIAESVLAVLGDRTLQGKLADAARDRQRCHYSWDSVCRRYDETLRMAMDPTSPTPLVSST